MHLNWRDAQFIEIIKHASGRIVDEKAIPPTTARLALAFGTIQDVIGFTDGTFIATVFATVGVRVADRTWFNGEQRCYILEK